MALDISSILLVLTFTAFSASLLNFATSSVIFTVLSILWEISSMVAESSSMEEACSVDPSERDWAALLT